MNSIAYIIGDNLYLNITNRCSNKCDFCIRFKTKVFNNKYPLWLKAEPSTQDIIKAIGDASKYKEVVFCGFGEPLIRLEQVLEVSKYLKEKYNSYIRIDTDGEANLYHKKNILPQLKGLVDAISVSLNAHNADIFDQICHSSFGKDAYPGITQFIKEAKIYIPRVTASVVDLPIVDKEICRGIASDLGVEFRVRPYYEEEYIA